MKLSIIVPVYNEINYLESLIQALTKYFKDENVEYIFVNDGSTDGSEKWLSEYINKFPGNKFKFINIEKNQGKGFAVKKGLEFFSGDYVLFQDADLELNPKDSYDMFQIIKDNSEMKIIFGSRFLSGKLRNNNKFYEFIGKLNSFLFNILFIQSISDVYCGTKIISREVLDNIDLTLNDFGFEIDLATQIAKKNYKIYEYGISYFARTYAEGKKITWIDGILSYFYLFKTRFIDNDFSTQISIIFSSIYMMYIGTYFDMGFMKYIIIIIFAIIGCFIGLHRKILASSIILALIYLGSVFSFGNVKIYTVLIGFFLGLYISKKISLIISNLIGNKFIKFLF